MTTLWHQLINEFWDFLCLVNFFQIYFVWLWSRPLTMLITSFRMVMNPKDYLQVSLGQYLDSIIFFRFDLNQHISLQIKLKEIFGCLSYLLGQVCDDVEQYIVIKLLTNGFLYDVLNNNRIRFLRPFTICFLFSLLKL